MKNSLNIIINDERWNSQAQRSVDASPEIFEKALSFLRSNAEIDFLPENKPIVINLCLSNDEEVHAYNLQFRGMDKPTNVLSFANVDSDSFEDMIATSDEIELGDIIIALETMQREAKVENISFENHYAHLLVHGILHLCGFDHQEDEEAEYMEGLEIKILAKLGIDNPYKDEK